MDYARVADKEKLTELQLRIKQLLNQVDQISKEQEDKIVYVVITRDVHIRIWPLYLPQLMKKYKVESKNINISFKS